MAELNFEQQPNGTYRSEFSHAQLVAVRVAFQLQVSKDLHMRRQRGEGLKGYDPWAAKLAIAANPIVLSLGGMTKMTNALRAYCEYADDSVEPILSDLPPWKQHLNSAACELVRHHGYAEELANQLDEFRIAQELTTIDTEGLGPLRDVSALVATAFPSPDIGAASNIDQAQLKDI